MASGHANILRGHFEKAATKTMVFDEYTKGWIVCLNKSGLSLAAIVMALKDEGVRVSKSGVGSCWDGHAEEVHTVN